MITAKLEEAIWEGKAHFKTHVCATTENIIPTNDKSFCIITDVWYECFVDLDFRGLLSSEDFAILNSRSIHQVVTRDSYSNNVLMAKDDVVSSADAGNGRLTSVFGHRHWNTYFVHRDDKIFVDILHMDDPNGWTVNNTILPVATQSIQPPNGFGNDAIGGLPVIDNILFGGSVQYSPLAKFSNVINDTSYNQFRFANTPSTVLNNPTPTNQDLPRMLPIVTIGYVEFTELIPDFMRQSN